MSVVPCFLCILSLRSEQASTLSDTKFLLSQSIRAQGPTALQGLAVLKKE